MSSSATEASGPARSLQARWSVFLVIGLVLLLCGAIAILLPSISNVPASLVLGAAVAFAGIVKVLESFQIKGWSGFVWQLFGGIVEIVGGVFIYLNPLKGAVAITLIIAAVFVIVGIAQIGLALKVQPQDGWGWLLASGVLALIVGVALIVKVPFTAHLDPALIAGISLLFAGWAYLVIAYAARRAVR
jgi:uncharacterized membrane protein HdeD (DUF308 family)